MQLYEPWAALACTGAAVLFVMLPVFASADKPPNDDRVRLPSIDGLRGFAAFGVFLHHASITHDWITDGVWQLPPSRLYSMLGQVGVAVFFLITGFLFWSILLRERGRPRWIALYVGRVFRIGPVYTLAIACAAVIVAVRVGLDVGLPFVDLVAEVGRWLSLGIFSVGTPKAGPILAGVTWTLQYEWWFYAALPLLAIGARRQGVGLPFSAALVAASLAWWLHGGPFWAGRLDPVFALLFAYGIACATLRSRGLLPALPGTVLSGAAVGIVILVFVLFPSAYGVLPATALACAFSLVVAGGDLFGLLNSRAARRLGDVSFGIYLLQGPVLTLTFMNPGIRDLALSDARLYWLTVLIAGLVLVGVATAAHEWIERPGIRAGKALTERMVRFTRALPRAG